MVGMMDRQMLARALAGGMPPIPGPPPMDEQKRIRLAQALQDQGNEPYTGPSIGAQGLNKATDMGLVSPGDAALEAAGINRQDYQLNAGFADRMLASERSIRKYGKEGQSLRNYAAGSIPVIGNYAVTDDYQLLDQAARDWTNAQLRRESGATIQESEFSNAAKQYFPQPGDTEATLLQKQRNREIAIESMKRAAGPAYRPVALIQAIKAIKVDKKHPDAVRARLEEYGVDPALLDEALAADSTIAPPAPAAAAPAAAAPAPANDLSNVSSEDLIKSLTGGQ